MNLLEMMREGLRGLRDHPFRTFLTTLGIIFGVAAVIAMVSIGEGARREALAELARFGTTSIRLQARILEGEPLKEAIKKMARGLSCDDAAFLREACPFLTQVVGEKVINLPLFCLGRRPRATVVGVEPGFLAASRLEVECGRFLAPDDEAQARAVVVLGRAVAADLVPEPRQALGLVVQLGRLRCLVVGVMREQGRGAGRLAIKSRDHDRDVYLPLRVTRERLYKYPLEDRERYHELTGLWLDADEGVDLPAARDVVMRMLRRRHREVDDVEALVPLEILEQSQKTQGLFNWVMALIAGLSLLVGGIGIMNIMLASVHERTREIGVRRALGASRREVALQFLTEASLISVLGGLAGVGVGMGLARAIALATGWTTVIPLSAVGVAFVVSLTVGVTFGFFPAVQAARLDPVQALRHE